MNLKSKLKHTNKEEYNPGTEHCSCDHMLKSHNSTHKWNNKTKDHDVRMKCRYCKCNKLLPRLNKKQIQEIIQT